MNAPKCCLLRFLAVALISLAERAAPAALTNSSWFARAWQTDDGLPNNTVTGIAQTPDGFLWVATTVGLARFDGIRFEELYLTNYVKEPNRGVVTLAPSRSGGLWLVMDRGQVVGLNSKTHQVFTTDNGLPARTAEKLTEDGEGAAWVGYRDGTVCRLRDGKVSRYGQDEGVPRGEVYSMVTDRDGRVWLAAGQHVCRFRDGRFETVVERTERPIRLAPARSGGTWICAGLHLLRCAESGEVRDCGEIPAQRAGTEPTVLLEDRSGGVWIGTYYSGLARYDGTVFQSIPALYRDIISLGEDQEGNLWVGTAGGGLNRIRTRTVVLESEEAGSPIAEVQSLSEQADGTLWAITRNGLLVYRGASGWNTISNSIGGLACVAADRAGLVWMGTRSRQIYRWQDGRFSSWGPTQELRGQVLHCLLAASTGDLWVGGAPGFLQRMRAEQIEPFNLPADAGSVRTMIEDCASNIWIGTARGTLLRVNGHVVTDETERLGLPRMSIRTLSATADGSVWIGYAGWGLGRLKQGHLSRITTDQGLYDNFVSQIVDDGGGWLWCAGDHGIFKVRLEALEDLFAGRHARVQTIHYGAEEGLPSLQAAFGVSPGALRTRDGRLWLPMRTGLAVVDPGRMPRTLPAPSVVIDRMKVDGRTVGWYAGLLPPPKTGAENVVDLQAPGSKPRLGPAFRRLEFEFTAPSLAAPDNVHFRYRLAGYEEDWTETTARTATYSRLGGADYRFEVTSCNADGVWSPTGTAVEFSVAPFIWQTWWFRLTALGGFTAAVVGIGRYVSFRRLRARLRGLEQQAALHKERTRIARDIHDDLGTRLSEIALLSELALRKPANSEQPGEHARQIASTVRQVTDSLDEIVWAINPRNDTLPDVVSYIGQFALRFLQMAGIGCHLDLPDHPPKRTLSAEVRHNLFLVAKEGLNNIVRHAQASEVWLSITLSDSSMDMTIKDNGRGFADLPEDANADGLRNMRQRMSEIGGECRVQSKPGSGTEVTFSYRLPGSAQNEADVKGTRVLGAG